MNGYVLFQQCCSAAVTMQCLIANDQIRREGLGTLYLLPDALLSAITFYLDIRTISKLACCSKLLRVFAQEPCLWMHHALAGHDGPCSYQDSWRKTALCMLHQAAQKQALLEAATRSPSEQYNHQQLLENLQIAISAAVKPTPPVPGFCSEFFYRRWYRSNVDLSGFVPPADQIPRVPHGTIDADTFWELYDKPAKPVILTGFMTAEWPQGWQQHWQLESLAATYKNALLKASRPSGGKTVIRLGDYVMNYLMTNPCDEEPLYVFDEEFGDRGSATAGLIDWYQRPSVIDQDYTEVLGDSQLRPDYRWLVVGPCRAGASWHVDPELTSAWNALTSGLKRWALYPPHVTPPGLQHVQQQQQQQQGHTVAAAGGVDADSSSSSSSWCTVSGSNQICHPDELDDDVTSSSWTSSSSSRGGDESPGSGLTSLQWYLEVYPHLPPHQRPYEFIQHPGEVVYIPGGWWHLVLNLTAAVAVTQNFVTTANLDRIIGHAALGSRVYEDDVMRFYDDGCRSWVRDWQQWQRQQWEVWQQQQQQQHGVCIAEQGGGQCISNAITESAAAGAAVAAAQHDRSRQQGTTAKDVTPSFGFKVTSSTYAAAADDVLAAQITCYVTDQYKSCNYLIECSQILSKASADDKYDKFADHDQDDLHSVCDHQCDLDDHPDHDLDHSWQGILQCVRGNKGYRRSRMLGTWLRLLWQQQQQDGVGSSSERRQQQQQLRRQIAAAADKYLAQREWQRLLHIICAAHQIKIKHDGSSNGSNGSSGSSDLRSDQIYFPSCGSDSLVFDLDDVVIKILVDHDDLPAHLAAAVEAKLLLALGQQQQQQQQQQGFQSTGKVSTPQLLGHGVVDFCEGASSCNSSRSRSICKMPYLVLSKVPGDSLTTAAAAAAELQGSQQQQQLAAACGEFLARIHSLPLQLQAVSHCSSSTKCGQQTATAQDTETKLQQTDEAAGVQQMIQHMLTGSVWRDREGAIWSSRLGHLDQQQQQHAVSSTTPAAAVQPSAAAADHHDVDLWWPFLQFLDHRRSDLLDQVRSDQSDLIRSGSVAAEVYQRYPDAAAALSAVAGTQIPSTASTSSTSNRNERMSAGNGCSQSPTGGGNGGSSSSGGINRSSSSSSSNAVFPVTGVGEDALPAWLVQQLDQYLPRDMIQIIGEPDCSSGIAAGPGSSSSDSNRIRKPAWLHGDLMAGNILLQFAPQQQQQQQHQQREVASVDNDIWNNTTFGYEPANIPPPAAAGREPTGEAPEAEHASAIKGISVIDFSDSGAGDPLYDFVAVFVSVLNCDVQLLKHAMETYSRAIDVAGVWPARPLRSCQQQQRQQLQQEGDIDRLPAFSSTCTASLAVEAKGSRAAEHTCSVSKSFMVYLLLHEEGVMGQLMQQYLEMRCAGSLEGMQQQLFGWMDDWWERVCCTAPHGAWAEESKTD